MNTCEALAVLDGWDPADIEGPEPRRLMRLEGADAIAGWMDSLGWPEYKFVDEWIDEAEIAAVEDGRAILELPGYASPTGRKERLELGPEMFGEVV